LRPLEPRRRDKALDALRGWAGSAEPGDGQRPAYRTLRPDELCRLAEYGLIEIGAHSVSHQALAYLPLRQQLAEIGQSKRALEEIVGRPVTGFAYPFGQSSDYVKETVSLVRHAGYKFACTQMSGVVTAGRDPYQWPRLAIPNLDGDAFARNLRHLVARADRVTG
jgi:peptidoglycan/xylan/chitin deacetylase (PgdA/CDA1 family)